MTIDLAARNSGLLRRLPCRQSKTKGKSMFTLISSNKKSSKQAARSAGQRTMKSNLDTFNPAPLPGLVLVAASIGGNEIVATYKQRGMV